MNHDRDRTQTTTSSETSADLDAAPGRAMRTGSLVGPNGPLVSGLLQRKARDSNGVGEGAEQAVGGAQASSGSALPGDLRARFEGSLGTDLSSVRVHTGSASQNAAAAVGARAYAMGNDIHFGAGQLDTSSRSGQHLLAHEVAHTVQQRGGSPTRQNKLEVSAPGDAAEHEADRAADAMVSGAATSVTSANGQVHRSPFDQPNNPFGMPAPQNNNPFGLPAPQPSPVNPLGGPNADKNNIPYDIPTGNPQSAVTCSSFPPVTAQMPPAGIGDPGAIPDWQTIAPAQTSTFGPFQHTDPAKPYIVHGDLHSQMAKDAWTSYRQYLMDVASAWDSGMAPKINTFTQEAHTDPELDKLISGSNADYGMDIQGGKGTVAQQGGQQHVSDGTTVDDSVKGVADGGKNLQNGAKASVAGGNTSGPIKTKVEAVNAAKKTAVAQIQLLGATNTELSGAKTTLEGTSGILSKITEDQKSSDEAKKSDADKAKALGDKINPTVGDLAHLVASCIEPAKQLKTVGEGLAKLVEDDPRGLIDVAKGAMGLMDLMTMSTKADELALMATESPYYTSVKGAAETVKGIAERAKGFKTALDAALETEKVKYDELAAELEKAGSWKGSDPKDGKRAADALKAIPVVDRILTVLHGIKSGLPKAPTPDTRASQGYTLATQGVNGPGAADLHRVLGWFSSGPDIIDGQITHFEGIRKSLGAVGTSLGIH